MKVFCIAGEASGDLHGSNLVKSLVKKEEDLQLKGWGGDLMEEAGVEISKHYRELAFMGFVEVLMNIRTILSNIKKCKTEIEAFQPDALLLIDYPGFNLRIAEWAHEKGIKIIYYISPQIWAWKKNRVFKIKKCVDQMMVILPFEQDFYAKYDVDVDFVGHPLLDALPAKPISTFEAFCQKNKIDTKPIIALLPGSRKQEIAKMLSKMLTQQKHFPDYQFVIAGAPSQPDAYYQEITKGGVPVIHGSTYEILQHAQAALVTSGTATLETALLQVPEVVCYSSSVISYNIAKKLVDIKFISLVNLIMDREVVKELIQSELNEHKLKEELKSVLPDGKKHKKMSTDYLELREKLGGPGASSRAADVLLKTINRS